MANLHYEKFTKKQCLDKCLFTLKGIIDGVLADEKVNHDEVVELKNWIAIHDEALSSKKHPFPEINNILSKILEDGVVTDDEIEELKWLSGNFLKCGFFYDEITHQLQILQGYCYGIIADDVLSEDEVLALKSWLDNNSMLSNYYPYSEICDHVRKALTDNKLTEDELQELKSYFSKFVDLKTSANLSNDSGKGIYNFYDDVPDFHVQGKTFCFTGKSDKGSRKEVLLMIEDAGGIPKDRITRDVDYLILAGDGNPSWAFINFGRKIEKVKKLQKDGFSIKIIPESILWDSIKK